MESLGVFVANAANDGLGQSQCTNTNQQPLADVKGNGHFTTRKRLQHVRVSSADVSHHLIKAAACLHHSTQKQAHTYNHRYGTAGICYGNTPKTANSSINNNNQTKQAETCKVGKACYSFKKLGCTNKLSYHCSTEEGNNNQSRHICKKIRLITGTQNVDNCYSIDFTGYKSNFLTKNAKYKEYNDYLNNCHIEPAIANNPSHARTAYKGTNTAVGCSSSHCQNKTAKSTTADKIILGKVLFTLLLR